MNNVDMSKKTTEFGLLCRQYRISLKINMIQAATELEVNQSDISKIENGEQQPSFDYIKKSIELYKIKEKEKQFEFFLSSLKCSRKIDIPLNILGPIRKEWLAAIFTYGDVNTENSKGWNELLEYIKSLIIKLENKNPKFIGKDEIIPL